MQTSVMNEVALFKRSDHMMTRRGRTPGKSAQSPLYASASLVVVILSYLIV